MQQADLGSDVSGEAQAAKSSQLNGHSAHLPAYCLTLQLAVKKVKVKMALWVHAWRAQWLNWARTLRPRARAVCRTQQQGWTPSSWHDWI